MSDKQPNHTAVVPFKPRVRDLESQIHRIAKDSSKVLWKSRTGESHAESRMDWRGITSGQMFEVLRTGMIRGEIEPGRSPGEWKVKLCKVMKGRREIGVVTVVIKERLLFVKTVEWEDVT